MALADIRSEVPRTFFHILGGLALAWIGLAFDPPLNKILLGLIFVSAAAFDVLRLMVPAVNRLAGTLIGAFMRATEEEGLTGAPAFTGGVFLAFVLFREDVALAAMVPLFFGDRAGLIVGKSFGRLSFRGKTVEGSLACLTVSFLVYLLLRGLWPEAFGFATGTLLAAALVGTLAEALPRPFDDNLTIPLAVGLFITLVT